MSRVLPLIVICPLGSKRLLPSALTLLETKRALGNSLTLNQPLPTTSSLASLLPASTLARSTSICALPASGLAGSISEEHTSELQSRENLVCRLLLEKKKNRDNKQRSGLLRYDA